MTATSIAGYRARHIASDTAPAVRIDGLVKSYAGRRVVDGVTLAVERGTVFALLGANGAGKTTTVEICAGFRRPDAGQVRVLGLDPEAPALRPKVGIMLQDGIGAYTAAKAREVLDLFAAYARRPHDTAALLDLVGLTDVAGTTVKRLSGGQRQRLSLALALVGRPELVFLDEPTAGLDAHARRATWQLIERLRDDGVTVVLTTHLLDEAEQLADVVAVLADGRIVATGSPAELTRFGSEGQIRFRAPAGLALTSLQDALPGGASATEEAPGRYVVSGPDLPRLLAATTGWCADRGVLAEHLGVERRSLEDVFFALTGSASPA